MDTSNRPERQLPRCAPILLSLVGGLFAFVGVLTSGVLFPVLLAVGSALCAYAVLYAGNVLLLLSPLLFYAVDAWILQSAFDALPVIFAVPLAAVLTVACRRSASKSVCSAVYAAVFAVLLAGWFALSLYLRFGKLDGTVLTDLETQLRDLAENALSAAGLTEQIPQSVWALFRILLIGSFGALCSFFGILASCLLSLPAPAFGRRVVPATPWRIGISPVGAVVFLLSILCAVFGGGSAAAVTGEILLLLLAPYCMSVGLGAVAMRRIGPDGRVIRFSPLTAALLILGFILYTPVAVLVLAVHGAVITLVGVWLRYKQRSGQ